ncbi:MAG: S8 family serine peptidase [bacterium]
MMKNHIGKVPVPVLITGGLALLGLGVLCLFCALESRNAAFMCSNPAAEIRLTDPIRENDGDRTDHETGSGYSAMNEQGSSISSFITKKHNTGDAVVSEDPLEDREQEETSSRPVRYSTRHILVKFTPEVEEEIDRGEKPPVPGKLQCVLPKGRVWKVEVEADGSVEELLEEYQGDHADMVQYAQLDYECDAQGGFDKDRLKRFASSIEKRMGNKKLQQKPKRRWGKSEKYSSEDSFLWYLKNIDIETAWVKTFGNPSVTVALLDTGVAYEEYPIQEHELPRLSTRSESYMNAQGLERAAIWINEGEVPGNGMDDDLNGYVDDVNGFDFIDRDAHPNDDNGHGTHLANLIWHSTTEASIGIAPDCTLMIVKVLDHRGKGFSCTLAEGIYYAVDHGADIINLSLAWPVGLEPGPVVHDAILHAHNAGVIVVAGTGNDARDAVCYPAAYNEVIAVGAVQFDSRLAYYSNHGPEAEVVAPGGNLYLDLDGDRYPDGILQETFDPRYEMTDRGEILADPSRIGYTFLQGTSMATGITTGVIALILSVDPSLDTGGIRDILAKTALDLGPQGRDAEYGYGLINAGGAISFLSGLKGRGSYLAGVNLSLTKKGNIRNAVTEKDAPKKLKDKRDKHDDDDDDYWDDDNKFRAISAWWIGNMDMDDDGYVSYMAGGLDCDDHDPAVYPGAPEIANDGIDQDCDGEDLVLTNVNLSNNCECAEGTEADPEIPEYVTCDNGEEIGEGCI